MRHRLPKAYRRQCVAAKDVRCGRRHAFDRYDLHDAEHRGLYGEPFYKTQSRKLDRELNFAMFAAGIYGAGIVTLCASAKHLPELFG